MEAVAGTDATSGAGGGGVDGPALPAPRVTDSVWIVLGVLAVLALAVAFRFATRSHLWADEALSVDIAGVPIADLPAALKQDGAPPLYYFLLHFWMRVFGTGDVSVRALSGAFAVATLPFAWFAGRRLDLRRAARGLQSPEARTVAWAAVLILAASPFAIRYGTEARMYALVIFLTFCGYLAVARALEQPSFGRNAVVAIVTAALLYTHYWGFALVGVTGAWLIGIALLRPGVQRIAALRVLLGVAAGVLGFAPWSGTFLFQLQHTGTPWASGVSPVSGFGEAFVTFGGNTHVVGWALVLMAALGLFARGVDRRHVEVDLWTRPGVRVEVGIALVTLTVGLVLALVSGTTFEGRYAAVMFPLILLAAAFGVTAFASRPVRYAVLVLLILGGFWGGTSNALRDRTQAFQVRDAIVRNGGRPGDVVVYCPDSVGSDTTRLLPPGYREITFPDFTPPGRVDWVDYASRVRSTSTRRFAARLVSLAGPDHSIWFVYKPEQPLVQRACDRLADVLTVFRPSRLRLVEPNPYFFEAQGLYRFTPPSP
jgi:hypothetical protein